MANLINLWAESGADLIGDDSTPTLTINNTSSGLGLSIDTTGGTGSAFDAYSDNTSYAARVRSNVAAAPALVLSHGAVVGSATIAPLELVASTASQAFINFGGILLSTASMNTTAAQSAFHIPVKILRALLAIIGAKFREFGEKLDQLIPSGVPIFIEKRVETMYGIAEEAKDIVRTVWGHTELDRNVLALALN